jgi:tetratricopeptide (TPR) repeat protein
VLIELAMREPDIPAAWACLGELQQLSPRRPTLLSFEGQIHWFGGEVQAAHDALARLLERHPDYCRGITIENDLAVMLQALGRVDEAEAMARRSLESWAGVAHTETLSLLVLGLTLTSAGRHGEADAALGRALQLAREQASPGFEAEALVRRARLWLQWNRSGDADAAHAALETAAAMLAASPEPLRVSQLSVARVQASLATGRAVPGEAVPRLEDAARRSTHPLVHARHAQVRALLAASAGDAATAASAAEAMAGHARAAGLMEPLAEALLLRAVNTADPQEAAMHARAALDLAQRQGLGDLQVRAARVVAAGGALPSRAGRARR